MTSGELDCPMRHWLLKTEPDTFSMADLLAAPAPTPWEGVRNYQARNFLREMQLGDQALIYHSSTQPPGVAGVAEVVSSPYPDPTQFDPDSPYFDPKVTSAAPRWSVVDVRAVRALPRLVPLSELRADPALAASPLLKRGSRLSVIPVSAAEFKRVLELGQHPPP